MADRVRHLDGIPFSIHDKGETPPRFVHDVHVSSGRIDTVPTSASVVEVTGDTTVKSSSGKVYGLHICFDGVTVGDKVELKDDGSVRFTFVADATDQSYPFTPCVGMPFDTDISVAITKTSGSVYVTLVYS